MSTPAITDWHRELLTLINDLRAEYDAPPLAIDASLQDAAAWRAHDMLTRNYFAYDTPPVGPREAARPEGPPHEVIRRFGYTPASPDWTSAENLLVADADGAGTVAAGDVFAAWRDSPQQRQNMTELDFRAIGIGGPVGAPGEHPMAGLCVVEFGSELTAPVAEPALRHVFLPRAAPPSRVPHEQRGPADRIEVAQALGKRLETLEAPLPEGPSGAPSGPVRTPAPWGSFGTDWSDINRWDDILQAAAAEFGVPFPRLKGHVVIESQGNPKAIQKNDANGWSYGLMQVVPFGTTWEGWHADVIRLAGHDGNPKKMLINDPALNVRVGAYILAVQRTNYGTWDKASSSFFLGNPDWIGQDRISGATGKKYRAALNGLMEEIVEAGGGNNDAGAATGVVAGAARGTGAALAAEARRHVGKDYEWATAGPKTFDCSGLVYYCYAQVTGDDLDASYRDSHKQFLWGDEVDPAQALPGDLVFYDTSGRTEFRLGNYASHVGIYGGGNELISALNPSQGVQSSDLSGPYWTSKWIGTRRVLPPA